MTDRDPLSFFVKVLVFAIVLFGVLTLIVVGLFNLF